MSEKTAEQLLQFLNRLDSKEKKLQSMGGLPTQISGLEKSLNNVLEEVRTMNEKTKRMDKNIRES